MVTEFNALNEGDDTITNEVASSTSSYSPTATPIPKRRHDPQTVPTSTSTSTSLQKEAMLGAVFKRMMQEDEWDKTTSALAEHIRNAVAEFPILADDFRMRLLQLQVDVQKERAQMRQQPIIINIGNDEDFQFALDNV